MRVIATSVVRESTFGKQKTGYVYEVDWETERVFRRFPVPDPRYPESDDNPRGGIRGGRGVASTRHGIFLANYDTIYRYDDDCNVLEQMSHDLFVGLHEIYWDGEHLWVTATGIDAVLRVGIDGTVEVAWDPHAPDLARQFGLRRRPTPLVARADGETLQPPMLDDCHINGVTHADGDLVVNCGLVRKRRSLGARVAQWAARTQAALGREGRSRSASGSRSIVVRIRDGATETLVDLEGGGSPTHNGQLLDENRVAVNESETNTLRVFSVPDRREVARVRVEGTWLRGLYPLAGGRVLVGTAPAAIALIDLGSQAVEKRLELSENPNEAIHGLTVHPSPDERR